MEQVETSSNVSLTSQREKQVISYTLGSTTTDVTKPRRCNMSDAFIKCLKVIGH